MTFSYYFEWNKTDKQTLNVIIERHLTIDEHYQGTAVECLATSTELSRQQIKIAMQKGAVWLSQGQQVKRLRRAKKKLQPGNKLHLYYDDSILSETPSAATLIADETAYSIWYKPYGMYSQGSKWGDHCTINRYAEQQLDRTSFIVHRLDRAATGLIIIAHSKSAAAEFNRLFQQRAIEKNYRAVVNGHFPERETICLDSPIDSKPAVSHVNLLHYNADSNRSLVEVNIETGRKHQIRKHLATYGYPIVGDRLYNPQTTDSGIPAENNEQPDLQLCSCSLAFEYPEGEKRRYQLSEALMPEI